MWYQKKFTMKKILLLFFILVFVKVLFFPSSNDNVQQKVDMIKDEVKKMGYTPIWFIISEKRSRLYNSILKNSAKNSYHINGNAIDVYVIDVDGDLDFDEKDIKIIEKANKLVENKNKNFVGALGTYRSKGYLTRHMIHFDTRGYKKRYY